MRDVSKFELLNVKGDCFDIIVASFAKWLKGEYRHLFIDCLGFGLSESGETVGEKIFVAKGDIIATANKNGINTSVYNMKNLYITDICCLLCELNPIVMEFDEFDCSWRKNYRKLHRKHFILIFKYCIETGSFICTDTIPTDGYLKLSQEYIASFAKKVICLSDNMNPIAPIDMKQSLSYSIRKFSDRDKFGSIWDRFNLFIDDMLTIKSLEKESLLFTDVDIVNMPLIWNLKNIQFSFEQYKLFLNFTSFSGTKELFELINGIIKDLEIAINVLILSIIRNEYFLSIEKVRSYLRSAVNSMKDFAGMLMLIGK
ncbi:MAG: hypothetical protein KIC77_05685 [Clostridiales bacterium]|nr:hypothetical protein [Clostridiales bacterium]